MTNKIEERFLSTLKTVLPSNLERISLHEPHFSGNEWNYVKECIDSGWVSSAGKFVDRIESDLESFTGAKKAIAVVNGTAALHMCLNLINVQRGDEIIVPSLTFVATANAVTYSGAIPHFVDVELETLGLDPIKLSEYLKNVAIVKNGECFNRKTNRRIKAVVPMHTFGHPAKLDELVDVCEEYRLIIIEDAAESLGSYYKGKHTGNIGIVSALSFNGNKVVTTGGGGAILTNNHELGKRAKHLTTTAKVPHQWEFYHDEIGYNYRMPNINAALGCAQLESLPKFLEQKQILASKYEQAFKHCEGVKFFKAPLFGNSNYWLNAVILDEKYENSRDEILKLSNDNGVMTRPAWRLMHHLEIFKDCPRMDDLSVSELLEKRLINIPSSPQLA
jgi:perosamine synthetase